MVAIFIGLMYRDYQKSALPAQEISQQNDTPTAAPTPKMIISPTKKYTATMNTSKGALEIELFAKETPITVNNFVTLAQKNFFDGTVFHRVIKDFMVQGGDPTGTGSGGPGYQFADEKFGGEYKRGTLAMANAGPNTNGSQFFIVHKDAPQLPKNYVIFGRVTKGLEVLDALASNPVKAGPSGELSQPIELDKINTVTIKEQ
ncbi:MAG: putative peptidyl-prolyl cis-trans isomerase [Microgenomates bacterium OLB22]|nr:MAG: putative peptidyl-prolyl cis-trans isomerase [Microgenomates bacterium OLB22]